ncbi:hypothetical protein M9458_049417, partial [Cirrhinus mrigala]
AKVLLVLSLELIYLCPITDDITMVICPGIGNHSEKHYIRTFVDYSQKQGYSTTKHRADFPEDVHLR